MQTLVKGEQWRKGRGLTVGFILTAALIGFEVFNFDTTRFALLDLMSGHRFWGMEWSAILAFAFCSIDFAGLVRMFTPQQTLQEEPREVWLLMGAWLLGAGMNAVMTWYAVALVIAPRAVGATLITKETMLLYAPLFVALLVWLTRILLIGASSVAADRLMYQPSRSLGPPQRQPRRERQTYQPTSVTANGRNNFSEDLFTE